MHIIVSALKQLSTSTTQKRVQECREVMGANGYSKLNMLGMLRDNNDINMTWEGDNTVLLQQTAKFIIDHYRKFLRDDQISHDV
jgi:acyl-CoA oxidase